MPGYEVSFTNGSRPEHFDTYQDALDWVSSRYEEVGHDGDLSGGGDRTLFWDTEEDSIDDDGARAAGSIYRLE